MALTEFQTAWLKALRDGSFKQARAWLNYEGGYCCLGVACEVGIDLGLGIERREQAMRDGDFVYLAPGDTERATSLLTPALLTLLGITEDGQARLAEFNDEGKSFNWIAAYIERYPHLVFGS